MISTDRETLCRTPISELTKLMSATPRANRHGVPLGRPVAAPSVAEAIAQHRQAFRAYAAEVEINSPNADAANRLERSALDAVFAAPVAGMADVTAKAAYLLCEVDQVGDFFAEDEVVSMFLRSLQPAEAPAPDPMLDAVTAHRAWRRAYDIAVFGDPDDEDAWCEANPNPAGDTLDSEPPLPITTAGALAAVRFVMEDKDYIQKPHVAILRQALAFLEGGPISAVQCGATRVPAAQHDPLLDVLTTYRAQMDFYNGPNAKGRSDEQAKALEDSTWGPLWHGVENGEAKLPAATTDAGASFALRCLLMELDLDGFEEALLRAALAYLDGRAA